MTRCVLSACAITALAPVLFGANEDVASLRVDATPGPGSPAMFAWGDVDGDGHLELAAVAADGTLRVLMSAGNDRFEDVSERLGLAGIGDASLALWIDYDADGRLDLFVGARAGASRLFRNESGLLLDMTAAAGIATEGAVQSADWLDHDGDGHADLHVVTSTRHELYRGLIGGIFERIALPLSGQPNALGTSGAPATRSDARTERNASNGGAPADDADRDAADRSSDTGARSRARIGGRAGAGGAGALTNIGGSSNPLPAPLFACATAIRDQANPNACLNASTTPTLGSLYPISSNLFVAVSGDVGIGTTTPAARLHVAGTARVTNTLTLAPSGDNALDVSTGSIYKGGALFIHTKGTRSTAVGTDALPGAIASTDNTAFGSEALRAGFITTGNTAIGSAALRSNNTGSSNTATGHSALRENTTGASNTAVGTSALKFNTVGGGNVAFGAAALYVSTTGHYNTAVGFRALSSNTTASSSTALGEGALRNNTTGYSNTASGAEALRNNTIGFSNTADGRSALRSNVNGWRNTASGHEALFSNTAAENTAHGASALRSNTTGYSNTAQGTWTLVSNTFGSANTGVGRSALYANTSGSRNAAHGAQSLFGNTTGESNTASGFEALHDNTTGSRNIGLGRDAGRNLTTGDDNIDVGNTGVAGESATIRIGTAGTHTRAFVAGISGVTTGMGSAVPVVVDAAGQLGTISSSRRFKKDVEDMGDRTERMLELRPVVFRYRQEQTMPDGSAVPLEYGLIAEEVAEVFPDLVVYDDKGQPATVKYHLLSAMLLNELEKVHARVAEQSSDLASQMRAIEELRARLAQLEARGSPAAQPR